MKKNFLKIHRRNGGISEYRQEVIPKSTYQQRLESGEDSTAEPDNGDIDDVDSRFWSDYNRVYYHPRSLQQVPDLPDWESNKVDWNHRKSSFKQFDTVSLVSYLEYPI